MKIIIIVLLIVNVLFCFACAKVSSQADRSTEQMLNDISNKRTKNERSKEE